jgi:quinol monooxygenase YgiN
MIIVAGTIQIDASKGAEIEAAFEKMRAATLKESGCIAYQSYLDRGDSGTFFMFEKWENDESLKAHFNTPHMAEFGAALGKAGVKGTDVWKYEVSAESKLM